MNLCTLILISLAAFPHTEAQWLKNASPSNAISWAGTGFLEPTPKDISQETDYIDRTKPSQNHLGV